MSFGFFPIELTDLPLTEIGVKLRQLNPPEATWIRFEKPSTSNFFPSPTTALSAVSNAINYAVHACRRLTTIRLGTKQIRLESESVQSLVQCQRDS